MTNYEAIKEYSSEKWVIKEILGYLLLRFKDNANKDIISTIQEFLEDETCIYVDLAEKSKLETLEKSVIIDAEVIDIEAIEVGSEQEEFEEIEEQEEIVLNSEQEKAMNLILNSSDNFCVLGDAGTGKSTFLRELIRRWRSTGSNTMVLGSTGTAAINIDGVTAHSALKLPFDVGDYRDILVRELVYTDKLIFDEIAFIRFDLFNVFGRRIETANKQRASMGKQNIQIVVSGDFSQLAPVITDRDREALRMQYGNRVGRGFAFQAYQWNAMKFRYIYFKEQMRNKDKLFSMYLNSIKVGDKSYLGYIENMCRNNKIDENSVYVCSTNKEATEYNNKKLSEINEREYEFEEIVGGQIEEIKDGDRIAPRILKLKVGCRVMCTCNKTGYFVNGSTGSVKEIDDDSIKVLLDDGNLVEVCRVVESIKKYVVNEKTGKLETEEIATVEQFPLILAYAITIHKCQGKTLDKVRVNPYCWEHGQLYVALSRVRESKDMQICGSIYSKYLVFDNNVRLFYDLIKNLNELDK